MGDLVQKPTTDVANVDAQLAARALAMKENITISGNNIQVLKTGRFKFPGGEERETIDAVILDYRYRNQFFPKAYRKGEYTPASCFAIGDNPDTMGHSSEAPDPQGDVCFSCEKNQFGTALNGGAGKACQNQFLLAIMFPDLGESEEIYIIKASPTTVKAVAGYVTQMADQSGHPIKVVTRFSINTTGDWAKLKAEYAGPNPDYMAHAAHLAAAERVLNSVPKKDKPNTDTKVDSAAARGTSGRSRGK